MITNTAATLEHSDIPVDRPFLASDFRRLGLDQEALRAAAALGMVRRLFQGVYARADLPDTLETRASALSLVVPDSAVVVDRTAAWLHGVEVFGRDLSKPPPLQMYQRTGTRIRRPGVEGGRRQLLDRDVTTVRGIQATTWLRTALDLGRRVWRYDALGALDQFARLGVSPEAMAHEVGRFRGARGVRQLRVLVPIVDARSESLAESALRLHWYDAGLPKPEAQWSLVRDEREVYRLDLALPEDGYAAEYDGAAFHSAEDDVVHDDRRRTAIAREWDFHLEVFTKDDIYRPGADPLARLVAGRRTARTKRGMSPYI